MAVVEVRVENIGFVVLSPNEHVHYFLTALGAEAMFSMGCEHIEKITNQNDFPGHPMMNYEWTVTYESLHATGDNYTVVMGYLVALNYTLKIEHHRAGHGLISVISDKDYEGEADDDFDLEIVKIFKN